MKPSEVIELIQNGNEEFLKDRDPDYFKAHIDKQSPIITLLTCSDSRVQTSAILPDPVDNVFTVKNIGNQIFTSEGSLDYGILYLKTPVLMINGHSGCGAIEAFIRGYSREPDSIKRELDQLHPVFPGKAKDNEIFCRTVSNIKYQVEIAMEKYSRLVKSGSLIIAGTYYDFAADFKMGYGKLIFLSLNGQDQDLGSYRET